MKNLILLSLLLLLMNVPVNAQSGYMANRYYGEQYYIEDIPVGNPYATYSYGAYAGTYQTWKRAEWHSAQGGSYIYVWSGYSWSRQWYTGYYYWYTWVTYNKYMGY